jgi:hypothetical protein
MVFPIVREVVFPSAPASITAASRSCAYVGTLSGGVNVTEEPERGRPFLFSLIRLNGVESSTNLRIIADVAAVVIVGGQPHPEI